MHVGKTGEELAQADFALNPGQGRTEAEVPATGEGEMLARIGAAYVETLGIVEHCWVAVGGSKVDHHHLPAPDRRAADDGVRPGHPCGQLHGGVEAQDLLDRSRPQRRIGGQYLQLIGVVKQQSDPVAEQIDGGLETGCQHQTGYRAQFGLIQPDAILRCLNELAHQIIAGVVAQVLQMRAEPVVEP